MTVLCYTSGMLWIVVAIQLVLVVALLLLIIRLFIVLFFSHRHLPFLPSSRRVVNAMLAAPVWAGAKVVMDLGSGTGTLLARIRSRYPTVKCIGVEHSFLLVVLSRLRFLFFRHRPQIVHSSFFDPSVVEADVIVGFWITEFMPQLLKKFEEECRPGTIILSNLFRLPPSPQFRESFIPISQRHSVWVYERHAGDR